jgi:hypothetical protein
MQGQAAGSSRADAELALLARHEHSAAGIPVRLRRRRGGDLGGGKECLSCTCV